jgi:hypothetical protein
MSSACSERLIKFNNTFALNIFASDALCKPSMDADPRVWLNHEMSCTGSCPRAAAPVDKLLAFKARGSPVA